MLRKILRKSQPDFWHYIKKIEAQAKNGFLIKKNMYLEEEVRCDIEILSINRVLNKEHFHGKFMQKICTKS